MRLQGFTNDLLRYRWVANFTLGFTFLVTFVPIVGIVGIVIAAFITLRKSVVEGLIFTIAATLPYFISFWISNGSESSVTAALYIALCSAAALSNLLTWLLAVMLRRQANWSAVLQAAALLGVFAISVVHLAYPNIADWWGAQFQASYAQATSVLASGAMPSLNESQQEIMNAAKMYATGIIVALVIINAVMQLILARWWQAAVFSPGSLHRELHRIRLSKLAGVLFVLSLVCSYLGNSVVLDILPVLYVLFFAAGLSLVHYAFGLMHSSMKWLWLTLFYGVILISVPLSAIIIAMLALMDIWFDFRKRLRSI